MSQNSQALLAEQKKVKELERQSAILEQTVASRSNEVLAAQRKLDDLKVRFDKQTELLLAEQEKNLQATIAPLQAKVTSLQIDVSTQLEAIATNNQQLDSQNSDLQILDKAIIDKLSETKKLETDTDVLRVEYSQLERNNAVLGEQEKALSSDINTLQGNKSVLLEELAVLQAAKDTLNGKIAAKEAEFDTKIATKERQLAQLEAKLLSVAQEIEKSRQDEEIVRNELATWQRKLEGQDRNLRIREQKVEMGESKLISNANLMNL